MRKCGALLGSGYYNPPSSPVLDLPNTGARKEEILEKQRERKKVFIQVSPEQLNVAFGDEIINRRTRRCSDYTPASKGQIVSCTNYSDVWKCSRKDQGTVVTSSSRPPSQTSRGPRSRNETMEPGEVSLRVGSPKGRRGRINQGEEVSVHVGSPSRASRESKKTFTNAPPVAIRVNSPSRVNSLSPQRSPVSSRPSSVRRMRENDLGMQVDLTDGVQIKVNSPSPTRRPSTSNSVRGGGRAPSTTSNVSHFHLENNPAQSVTVRTMKDVNVRTQALKDGVQFQLDGKPGVQLSVKMGQPTKGGSMKNSIKIEAQTSVPDSFGSSYTRWGELLSYQRPTVSHLIHARMTQLYKELRKSLGNK